MQTVKQVRAGLPKEVPLIGFAGAPFTLASYAIEGGGSRDYQQTKRLMYTDEGALERADAQADQRRHRLPERAGRGRRARRCRCSTAGSAASRRPTTRAT